jgi:formyl-CoA transferase
VNVRPLDGIRVLDLGTRIGAPFAATLLGEFGADVIKIEEPGRGDLLRELGPFDGGDSLYFAVEGRERRSVTLDLRRPEGREVFLALVRSADVVVENFRPGTLERWDIGYDVLRGVNPRIVLSRVSVYGQDGPLSKRPGLDRNAIAFGGLLYLTGHPDRPPVRPGVTVADYLTGVFNAYAIMLALWERERSGEGQCIDLPLYGSVLRILEWTIAGYDRAGLARERTGNRLAQAAPADVYPTADGHVIIVAAGQELFERICAAMGRTELIHDPRFADAAERASNGDAINGIVEDWCRARTSQEVEDALVAADVPVSPVLSVADITAHPHVRERGDLVRVDGVLQQGVHPRLSRTPGAITRGAPKLGEHTDEVLRELAGLDDTAIAGLRERGVI